MTRKELIEMCGTEEQANFAMEILLKNVKPAFVKSVIKAEISETGKRIRDYKESGFIWTSNGTDHTDWNKPNEFLSLNMTEDEEKQYDEASQKCNEAEALLYRNNRLASMIAVR